MNVRLTDAAEPVGPMVPRTVSTRDAAVEFGRVTKTFGDTTAIEDVSLRVPAGEFTVLIGPSGCGKSTLLSLAAGLEMPTEGFVTAHGREVTGTSRDTALIFQQHNLFPWMTTEANVAYGLRSRGMGRRAALDRARELLARVGLADFAAKPPTALSGGMRQRVALVRAFAIQPKLLLMDEPFGALDHQTRKIMQAYLLSTWRNSGATVVMVTHDLDEALMLADRLVLFTGQPGRIAETIDIASPRPRSRDDPGLRTLGARLEKHLAAAAEAAKRRTRNGPVWLSSEFPGRWTIHAENNLCGA